MSIERIFHCDGPDCQLHARTASSRPAGFITVREGTGRSLHFCDWDWERAPGEQVGGWGAYHDDDCQGDACRLQAEDECVGRLGVAETRDQAGRADLREDRHHREHEERQRGDERDA